MFKTIAKYSGKGAGVTFRSISGVAQATPGYLKGVKNAAAEGWGQGTGNEAAKRSAPKPKVKTESSS